MNIGKIIALIKSLGGGGGSVPKPLTYDYMPEGYPTKIVQNMTLLDENLTLEDASDDGSGGLYMTLLKKTVEISLGTTYKVIFNGTEYNCTAFDYEGDIILGNLSMIDESGDDTGEPFMIMPLPTENWTYIYAKTANCTISISGDTTVYNVMSDDFLPKYTKLIKLPIPEVSVKAYLDAMEAQIETGAMVQWGRMFIYQDSYSSVTKTVTFYADNTKWSVSWSEDSSDFSQCYLHAVGVREVIPTKQYIASTSGKKFKITVDDNGTLSATEVTE